jgi:hypothetical protein
MEIIVPNEVNDTPEYLTPTDLPTARDFAYVLKERIRKYGGAKAVWRQIDNHLKDEDIKSIGGQKGTDKNKIKWEAFKRAYVRLGDNKEGPKLNKMSFGINGNPVLLMNIFEILGINSYRDLLKYEYKKPDIADEINNINTSIEEINMKIDMVINKIESKSHKSIRIIKINCDFHEVLERLYSILIDNKDISLEKQYKVISSQYVGLINIISQYKIITPLNINDYLMKEKYFTEINKKLDIIKMIEKKYQGEHKRTALLLFLFPDYPEYIIRKEILKKYFDDVKKIDLTSYDFLEKNTCLISPLFTIYFFLQLSLMFIKNTGYKTLQFEDEVIEYLKDCNYQEAYLNYIINKIKNISDKILKLLNAFIYYKIETIHNEKYTEYKNIATRIISLFYNIFIKRRILNESLLDISNKKKITLTDFLKCHEASISGTYTILISNIDELNIIWEPLKTPCKKIIKMIHLKHETERLF